MLPGDTYVNQTVIKRGGAVVGTVIHGSGTATAKAGMRCALYVRLRAEKDVAKPAKPVAVPVEVGP